LGSFEYRNESLDNIFTRCVNMETPKKMCSMDLDILRIKLNNPQKGISPSRVM